MKELSAETAAGGIVLAFILAAGIQDFRERRVSARLLSAYAGCGLIFAFFELRSRIPGITSGMGAFPEAVRECAVRFFPGTVLVLSSLASGGQTGMGDGLFFLLSGLFLTGKEMILFFWLTMAGAFCLAAAALLLGKGKKTGLPYLTIAAGAFVLLLIGRGA